jgi:hypothetical protein
VDDSPFSMTPVETVYREDDFRQFISFIHSAPDAHGMLASTVNFDDEKLLCV